MSWADDEGYRKGMRRPDEYELAEAMERRKATGAAFHPDVTQWEMPAPDSPAAREALKPILKAGRLSRFRILDVPCPNDHRLLEVVRTPAGPVVVGVGPQTYVRVERQGGTHYDTADSDGPYGPSAVDWEYDWERSERRNRMEPICCFLDDLRSGATTVRDALGYPIDPARLTRTVTVQCRCRTARISGTWLAGHIEAGRRRVVFE